MSQQQQQSNPVKPTKIGGSKVGNLIRKGEQGVKNLVKSGENKMTNGIVKMVGNTPAGAKLKAGLAKQNAPKAGNAMKKITQVSKKLAMPNKAKKMKAPSYEQIQKSVQKTKGY